MGSTASISSSKTIESCTLAAVSTTASGIPFRSETRWRFVPFFALSVGFAAVFGPPFWPGWKPNLVRHAPTLSGRPLRDDRARQGAASPTRPPHAIPSGVSSKSCPIRSPSPGEHLPGDTALEDEHDARQSCPIVDARSAALGFWRLRRQKRFDGLPQLVCNQFFSHVFSLPG
jgi:hypothetical protein